MYCELTNVGGFLRERGSDITPTSDHKQENECVERDI